MAKKGTKPAAAKLNGWFVRDRKDPNGVMRPYAILFKDGKEIKHKVLNPMAKQSTWGQIVDYRKAAVVLDQSEDMKTWEKFKGEVDYVDLDTVIDKTDPKYIIALQKYRESPEYVKRYGMKYSERQKLKAAGKKPKAKKGKGKAAAPAPAPAPAVKGKAATKKAEKETKEAAKATAKAAKATAKAAEKAATAAKAATKAKTAKTSSSKKKETAKAAAAAKAATKATAKATAETKKATKQVKEAKTATTKAKAATIKTKKPK